MNRSTEARPGTAAGGGILPWRPMLVIAGAVALFKLALHLLLGGRYGYFIDELYYLACARHPDWGYVDHPPLSIFMLQGWVAVVGDGLRAIRVPAALSGAGTVVLAGALAREFGAGRLGILLAVLCVLVSSLLLAVDHFYSMNAFEPVLWTGALLVLARTLRADETPRGAPRRHPAWSWLALGLLLGLGLLNKVGTLWLGGGIFLGLLLGSHRRLLRGPWPWAGAAVALLLFVPFVAWQARHDWATLEFIRNATRYKYGGITRGAFLASLAVEYNPLTLPVWLAGAWALLAGRLARPFRPIGVACATVMVILLVNGHSRAHYLSGAIPALYAAGGAWFGGVISRLRGPAWRPAVSVVTVVLLMAGGAAIAPLVLPVLSVEGYRSYARAIGFRPPSAEGEGLEEFPQNIADQFGWEELVDAMEAACAGLSPAERSRACIYAPFYGAAGALELLGRGRGLPPVICPQNSYWLWGVGTCDGSVVVCLGGDRESYLEEFETVEPAGVTPDRYGMPHVRNRPIWICRGMKFPLEETWRKARRFI